MATDNPPALLLSHLSFMNEYGTQHAEHTPLQVFETAYQFTDATDSARYVFEVGALVDNVREEMLRLEISRQALKYLDSVEIGLLNSASYSKWSQFWGAAKGDVVVALLDGWAALYESRTLVDRYQFVDTDKLRTQLMRISAIVQNSPDLPFELRRIISNGLMDLVEEINNFGTRSTKGFVQKARALVARLTANSPTVERIKTVVALVALLNGLGTTLGIPTHLADADNEPVAPDEIVILCIQESAPDPLALPPGLISGGDPRELGSGSPALAPGTESDGADHPPTPELSPSSDPE